MSSSEEEEVHFEVHTPPVEAGGGDVDTGKECSKNDGQAGEVGKDTAQDCGGDGGEGGAGDGQDGVGKDGEGLAREREKVIKKPQASSQSEQARRSEMDFVEGIVANVAPILEACDKQAYSVAESQALLLARIQHLEGLLNKFSETETKLLPSFSAKAKKLNDTRTKLSHINHTLSIIQTRLAAVTTQLEPRSSTLS